MAHISSDVPLCAEGLVLCYFDCCAKTEAFCDHNPAEQRCVPCDKRKILCGTGKMPPECNLYCHDLEYQHTTASEKSVWENPAFGYACIALGILLILAIIVIAVLSKRYYPKLKKKICDWRARNISRPFSKRPSQPAILDVQMESSLTEKLISPADLTDLESERPRHPSTDSRETVDLTNAHPEASQNLSRSGSCAEADTITDVGVVSRNDDEEAVEGVVSNPNQEVGTLGTNDLQPTPSTSLPVRREASRTEGTGSAKLHSRSAYDQRLPAAASSEDKTLINSTSKIRPVLPDYNVCDSHLFITNPTTDDESVTRKITTGMRNPVTNSRNHEI